MEITLMTTVQKHVPKNMRFIFEDPDPTLGSSEYAKIDSLRDKVEKIAEKYELCDLVKETLAEMVWLEWAYYNHARINKQGYKSVAEDLQKTLDCLVDCMIDSLQ